MAKYFTRHFVLICFAIGFFFSASAQSITLDSTFSFDGKVATDLGSYDDRGLSVKIQSDGKIIVAGFAYNGVGHDIALIRYETDGDLDPTFGDEGVVITKLGNNTSRAYSMEVQQDGKIVVAAEGRNDAGYSAMVLVRYNSNGALDSNFSEDGKVFTTFGTKNAVSQAIAIQHDQKILLTGYLENEGSYDFALLRYKGNGDLDESFGTNGIVLTSFGEENDIPDAIALQEDGKIVVVGSSVRQIAIARFHSNGLLDNSFSLDGKVTTPNNNNSQYSLSFQRDNKIVVVGGIGGDVALFRYTSSGELDNSFGNNGIVTTDVRGSLDIGSVSLIQPDGKIIVAGESYLGHYSDFALLRYTQHGVLDTTFDEDGIVTTDFANYNDWAYSMAMQKDGKLVLAGEVSDFYGYNFGVARYNIVGENAIGSQIKIYPNPTLGIIIFEGIDLNKLIEEKKFHLFDALGREINDFKIVNNSIDISSKPSGIYFLKFDGQVAKIIKVSF